MNALRIGAIFCKLDSYFPTINHSSVKPFDGLLSLVGILVTHKGKTPGLASPSIFGDEDVDDLAILVKEREEVVGGCAESDVEYEEGVGVGDVRRS